MNYIKAFLNIFSRFNKVFRAKKSKKLGFGSKDQFLGQKNRQVGFFCLLLGIRGQKMRFAIKNKRSTKKLEGNEVKHCDFRDFLKIYGVKQ